MTPLPLRQAPTPKAQPRRVGRTGRGLPSDPGPATILDQRTILPVRLAVDGDRLVAGGSRIIAVVLTGRGNDAATGTSAVHRPDGTVIASIIAASTRPSMPQSTMTRGDSIDHIVVLDDVAKLLQALVTHRR